MHKIYIDIYTYILLHRLQRIARNRIEHRIIYQQVLTQEAVRSENIAEAYTQPQHTSFAFKCLVKMEIHAHSLHQDRFRRRQAPSSKVQTVKGNSAMSAKLCILKARVPDLVA